MNWSVQSRSLHLVFLLLAVLWPDYGPAVQDTSCVIRVAGPKAKPRSSKHPICMAVLNEKVEEAEFERLHALTHQRLLAKGFTETVPGSRAAKIDLDNDGKEEIVVQLDYASGAGAGCDFQSLAVLNKTRTDLDAGALKELLASNYGTPARGGCNQGKSVPFRWQGMTYVHEYYPSSEPAYHKVIHIRGGILKTICEFEVP